MAASLVSLLVALGFVVCWSSGFIGGRLAAEVALPPMALFAWRFALATLLAVLWWRIAGTRSAACRGLFIEAGIGSLTMGGYLLGVMLAIQAGVGTSVTALITALQPLLAASLASLVLNERSGRLRWLGMAIASAGVFLCVAEDFDTQGGAAWWAYGLPLLSVVSVTLGSVLAARYPTTLAMDATLTAQLAAATGVFAVAALIEGYGRVPLPTLDSPTLTAIGWLVLFSSLGGYGFFVACLRRFGVNLTSTLIYLTPPVTMAWAAAMFGDTPGALGILGMLLASVGVGMALMRAGTRAPLVGNRRAC
ncbi:DMT family transporter [Halomonas sp. HP20-15]|uniref:DMT family transporter n=1 Tax=Halomonas sp. HP20-15 TaxID=3085901 RepID=UPI00298259C2|nr:DMT family transporter [Halomonas sp. HP20-15]MDW5376079.1 DMT family transporter [Halomonas sp. HP20-15]